MLSTRGVQSNERRGELGWRTHETALILSNRTDADSLAAAGLVLSIGPHPDPRVMGLLTRAAERGPDRPELAWLQAQLCSEIPACDPEPFELNLQSLAPSNGAGWMGALNRAHAEKDPSAMDAALEAIGRSDRLDIYYTTLVAKLTRAVAEPHRLSLREAEVLVIGYLAARAIPGYTAASAGCKGERLQLPRTLEACRGLARSFRAGDAIITEMIGVAITKRVWPENSPEWIAADESRHAYDLNSKRFLSAIAALDATPERYLELCEQNSKEQDVFRAGASKAGGNQPETKAD